MNRSEATRWCVAERITNGSPGYFTRAPIARKWIRPFFIPIPKKSGARLEFSHRKHPVAPRTHTTARCKISAIRAPFSALPVRPARVLKMAADIYPGKHMRERIADSISIPAVRESTPNRTLNALGFVRQRQIVRSAADAEEPGTDLFGVSLKDRLDGNRRSRSIDGRGPRSTGKILRATRVRIRS